jgi:hypothetical protein
MHTLTADRAATMIKWLLASHATLCAIPAGSIPAPLYDDWIAASAHTKIMTDDLLRLACADVAVEAGAV